MRVVEAEASAPGKLILFGEHAVVYGSLALAGALSDLRICVKVASSAACGLSLRIPDITQPQNSFTGECAYFDFQLDAAACRTLWEAAFTGAPEDPVAGGVLRPDAGTIKALEAALEPCQAAHRKGVMPVLFLAIAICGRQILASAEGGEGGLEVVVHTPTLPVAAGLGSSAAFSVAGAAALLDAWRQLTAVESGSVPSTTLPLSERAWVRPPRPSLDVTNAWAYCAEMLFHGAPSGLDNTVSTYGGAIAYCKNCEPLCTPASSPSFDILEALPPLRLLVTNTKVPKETSKLVAGVRVLYNALPAVVSPILTSIDALAKETVARLTAAGPCPSPEAAAELHAFLARVVPLNHSLLNALGVGHAALDGVARAAAEHGLVSKLTGAGGGGCAITLLPPEPVPEAVAALSAGFGALGYDCFETRVGGAGVLVRTP